MTRMMVRVGDADEARLAALAGVDMVEAEAGADASLPTARAVRSAFAGAVRLRIERPAPSSLLATAATIPIEDVIAPSFDAPSREPGLFRVVIVLASEDVLDAVGRAAGHADAVMLEADPGHRLIDQIGIAKLDAFASACRNRGLVFGLGGGLEPPDVSRLLLLEPDVLAFDRAVRRDHEADGPLDRAALDAIRALIPRQGQTDTVVRVPIETVVDRVFVRDFAISLAIGAYQAEHGTRQRVRFSVEADVVRQPRPPHDMRDVFSYDVIIETIRVLAERPHVTFVETLAEEVASALLGYAELMAVTVKVEKLDVIDGAVGIEIVRRRVAA